MAQPMLHAVNIAAVENCHVYPCLAILCTDKKPDRSCMIAAEEKKRLPGSIASHACLPLLHLV